MAYGSKCSYDYDLFYSCYKYDSGVEKVPCLQLELFTISTLLSNSFFAASLTRR